MITEPPQVTEIQGLYGPIRVPEKLLQRIWQRGEFNADGLRTTEGKQIRILHRGDWNLQEGPDFRDAELEIGAERFFGDIEIHFYMGDWKNHGHDIDESFDRVVLHVLLFEPNAGISPPKTTSGRRLHNVVLLPCLYQGLEDYANEEALLSLEKRFDSFAIVSSYQGGSTALRAAMRESAERRWREKRETAHRRIERSGWDEACHQCFLEVLGYRRNRVAMTAIAYRYPLSELIRSSASAEDLFLRFRDLFRLAGLRPANRPEKRIQQYLTLLDQRPSWPRDLIDWSEGLSDESFGARNTRDYRRQARLRELRGSLEREVVAQSVGGSRLDNLVCDAFLPLLAAKSGREFSDLWFHWYAGDFPETVAMFLKQIDLVDGRAWPVSNGALQGAMLMLTKEVAGASASGGEIRCFDSRDIR